MSEQPINNELIEQDFQKPVTNFTIQEKELFHLNVVRHLHKPTDKKANLVNSAILQYQPKDKTSKKSNAFLNISFILNGNKYCQSGCDSCFKGNHTTKDEINITFYPKYLSQFVSEVAASKKEKVLAFEFPRAFEQTLKIDNAYQHNHVSALIEEKDYTKAINRIFLQTKLNEILLLTLENVTEENESIPVCPFLAEAEMVNKIYDARDILLESLDQPITIKALSRKVLMNECYLKRGFKEIFGCTIFDFYQEQRMKHAKFLLYEKGLSVTDTALILGYSSISHFSTAFKKYTGLKPCELILRS